MKQNLFDILQKQKINQELDSPLYVESELPKTLEQELSENLALAQQDFPSPVVSNNKAPILQQPDLNKLLNEFKAIQPMQTTNRLKSQELENEAGLSQGLLKSVSTLNNAILGQPLNYGQEQINENLKNAGNITKQFDEQFTFERKDPNSAWSKQLQQKLTPYGINTEGMSAEYIEQLFPTIYRAVTTTEAQKDVANASARARAEDAAIKRQEQRDLLEIRRQDKKDRAAEVDVFKKESLALRKEQQVEQEAQRKVTNLDKFQQEFNKDKVVEKANIALSSAEDIKTLLQTNNPITSEAVKTALAKLSGEVGVLTDQDIARFGGSKAISARLEQAIKQRVDGKLTPENRRFMQEITTAYEQANLNKIQNRAEKLAEQGRKRLDITQQEALDYIGIQPSKRVIKKGYNAQTNQTQLIYSDGTKEIVDGKR